MLKCTELIHSNRASSANTAVLSALCPFGGFEVLTLFLSLQSPMMVWEFIHRLVEMLNRTFENVSELDIMINSALVRCFLCLLQIVWYSSPGVSEGEISIFR